MSSDRRTGKPIAVKLVKIKAEMLPEERISGQVGPDLHASPLTVLHGFIHPVKEHILLLCFIVLVPLMSVIVGDFKLIFNPFRSGKPTCITGFNYQELHLAILNHPDAIVLFCVGSQ